MIFANKSSDLVPNLFAMTDWGAAVEAYYHVWKLPLQFLIVFFVVLWIYQRIQGTYAAQLLKGVAVILALYLIAGIFNLTIISGILQVVIQISIIGFIILFQPELRRLLVYLGQPDFLSKSTLFSGNKEKDGQLCVHELVESVRLLSKTKTGALIVLESGSGLGGSYLEAGTRLDAKLSTELLLTIFHPNTPLHDGAVIVNRENQIVAAGVLLPLSENPNLSWKYGTRHRAAIGLSEISDSRCIVVSEETGTISMVYNGNIEKVADTTELKRQLESILGVTSEEDDKGNKRMPISELLSVDLFQKFFSKPNSRKSKSTGPSPTPDEQAKIGS